MAVLPPAGSRVQPTYYLRIQTRDAVGNLAEWETVYRYTTDPVTKYYELNGRRVALRQGGQVHYLFGDQLGSTSLVVDGAGRVVSEVRYRPWGEERYNRGALSTRYTYTGQYSHLVEFGLYFYNARWYSPTLGRFVSADTVIPPGVQGLDRYGYVNNNPVRYNDPTGHWLETLLDIAFIAYDIYDISQNGLNWSNGLSLAADVVGAVLPFVSGGGLLVRAATHADDVVDASRVVADVASHADEAADALKAVENVAEITNPLPKTQRFARAVPEDVARKIEAGFTNVTLARPGDPDVFITAAEDLARYRTQSAVESRLALPSGPQRAVVTFKYDWEAGGIASPILRNHPEFIGGGITAGGAREWVIPNRPLSKLLDERLIWDIKVRYLK